MAARNPKPQPEPVVAPVQMSANPVEAEAGGILTIDLGAIAANWRTLMNVTLPIECAAVVKADAYGLGIEPVVAALAKAGARTFFVADLAEARRVRAIMAHAMIYVLNGVMPNTAPAFAEVNARPVINGLTEFAEWDAFVTSTKWDGGAALHVDTGINRLGIAPEDAAALAPRINVEHHGISLLMSHLACAETPDHPLNQKQIRLFREVRLLFRGIPASLANSSGIFLGPSTHNDLVRPGGALFGSNPTPGRPNTMQPVIDLKARILQVRPVKRRDNVGYGATWTARRDSRIAIIAAGYGDGYLRTAGAASDKPPGDVIIAGARCPIVGRISMDLMAVDVTDLPDGAARRGGFATLIGMSIGVDDVAARAGTIGYEVLTALGRRYHRVWVNG